MPELPEVETVKRGLSQSIIDEIINKVEVHRHETVAYPAVKDFCSVLLDYRISHIDRRGKYLLFHLKKLRREAILVVHLRMSGRLIVTNKDDYSEKFLRLSLSFNSGKKLIFEDMRVFGRFWFVAAYGDLESVVPALAKLGPEPLPALKASQLAIIFAGIRQPIKAALLNQTLLAGLGNIYADEILFKAGVHPLVSAGELNLKQKQALSKFIPLILKKAITLGGSSLKDFKNSDGVNGKYQHSALVYGRTGKPCTVCGSLIQRIKIIGRSTHFCPVCQVKK